MRTAHASAAAKGGSTTRARRGGSRGRTGTGGRGKGSRTPRPQRLNPATLLLGLVLLAAAFVTVYWLFVGTSRGQWVDEQALRGAQEYLAQDSARTASMRILDELPLITGITGVVGLIVFAILRRSVLVPLTAGIGAVAAVLATQVLKHAVLDRPDKDISAASMNSFPSGHTTVAAAAAVALVLAAPPAARAWVALAGALASGATGAATIVMAWHRPSDVVGAFLVAGFFGWLTASAVAVPDARQRGRAPARPGFRSEGTGKGLSLTLAAIGVVLVLLAVALILPRSGSEGTLGTDQPGWFVLAGCLFIAGAALVVVPLIERGADAWLLRR